MTNNFLSLKLIINKSGIMKDYGAKQDLKSTKQWN